MAGHHLAQGALGRQARRLRARMKRDFDLFGGKLTADLNVSSPTAHREAETAKAHRG